MKREITDDMFWDARPGSIIEGGVARDDKNGVNFHASGEFVKWLAVKGGNDDWAIYFDKLHSKDEQIKTCGFKVSVENVRNLVVVSDHVLARYRK